VQIDRCATRVAGLGIARRTALVTPRRIRRLNEAQLAERLAILAGSLPYCAASV